MNEADEHKRAAGYAAVDRFVRDGTCIGLGTGTTARWAVERVGERVAAGERIVAVATSTTTRKQCQALGIPLVRLDTRQLEVAIDGADEVAADWSLTKGGGGALFREKAVAASAKTFVVVVTTEKLVERLGAFPTPVEVVPFMLASVLNSIGCAYPGVLVRPRTRNGKLFRTDNENRIIDCAFGVISDPAARDEELRRIHGVVETGLFPARLTTAVIVAGSDGVHELAPPPGRAR